MKSKKPLLVLLVAILGAGFGTWLVLRQPPRPVKPAIPTPVYDRYDYGRGDEARIIDVGMQPNDLGPAFISECLFHDRVLQEQLAAEGWKLRQHRYDNGGNMIPFLDGRLDVAFFGNQPSVTAMATRNVGLFAICAFGHNTLITTRMITPAGLKGLRIGYPPKTNAHFALERALGTANLSIEDVISVPMQPSEMESSLRNRVVDAVVSWEPTTSFILNNIPNTVPAFRSDSYTFVGFDLDFSTRHPALQKAILAAVVRASRWAKQDEKNILTGLKWVRQGGIAFSGKAAVEVNDQWVTILKTQGTDHPSFPLLPLDLTDEQGFFHQQFEFLKKIRIIPAKAEWVKVRNQVNVKLLPEIIRDGNAFQIDRFHYASDNLKLANEEKR